jgi:hypothetical protein
MASRREFLQIGMAAAVLPLTGGADESASKPVHEQFYKVVADERFPTSRAFADEMQRRGASVHRIQGDITDLWYDDLYHRWKQGALFCLERLAWDQGMRVVARIDHAPVDDQEALISWIIAPKPKAERT